MKTFGKFPLFILWVLVCGCPDQKPAEAPPSKPTQAEGNDSRSDLETACFEGDPTACDELGH